MTNHYKLCILALIVLPIATACSGSGGGETNNNSIVSGLDLSGAWRQVGVECYDSSLQNLTAVGTIATGSSAATTVISGNTLSSESINSDSCKTSSSRSIVANLSSGTSSGGYGTGSLGATAISINPGSSCTQTTSFNMTQGNINPSSFSTTYTQGEPVTSQSFEFIINPPYLALTSLIQVVDRPTDICFLIFQKL